MEVSVWRQKEFLEGELYHNSIVHITQRGYKIEVVVISSVFISKFLQTIRS